MCRLVDLDHVFVEPLSAKVMSLHVCSCVFPDDDDDDAKLDNELHGIMINSVPLKLDIHFAYKPGVF